MAAGSFSGSQHFVQWIHLAEEVVDENFLDVDTVVFDPHYETYTRPQLRSGVDDLVAMADSTHSSRMSHVEAWIDRELFGDVVEGEIQCQDEGEMYITTLRKDVDMYIESMQLDFGAADVVPLAIGGLDSQCYYHVQRDDLFLSPVGSEYRGMYYDEPQLWSFS